LGFGATVIALAVGSHFVPLSELVVALVLISFVQSSWLALRGRREIQWKVIATRIFPFVAVGFPIGIWCGSVFSEVTLKMILGGLVI
ncbi:hypothetical protein, partial [Phaeobacter italicus]|uniref:hypothetical protein n=1 Tax=Phaeobacter italicus TaxID=481446 RepID=UPI00248E6023